MTDNDDLKQEEMETPADSAEATSLDDMLAEAVPDANDAADSDVTPGDNESVSEEVSTESEGTESPQADVIARNESDEAISDVPSDASEQTESTDSSETPEETAVEMAEEAKEEEAAEEQTPVSTPIPRKEYKGKWYIVHTYSGHENKVAKTLMQRVQAMGFEHGIFDALVPTRDTIRVRGGKKETIKEKIFPGYILVNMDLSDEAWVLVRTTPGVTSFVGAQNKPTPIRDDEVQAIVAFVGQKDPVYKAQFSMGEAVKITDGPFSDFLGTVESIDEAKGKIKVLVSIFGRETPVELDFLQVAKI